MKVLGLDIGGTKCSVTACEALNKKIEILAKTRFLTDVTKSADKMIEQFYLVIRQYIDMYNCECIGISCGGPLDSKTGVILSPPNLPNFVNFNIKQTLENKFGIPVFLQNDANACALAEWLYGAGVGTENMIFLTFGTGLGGGLIINGKLYEGTNGNAGEVGHIRLSEDGPLGFGKQGSFEGFCSGSGIKQLGHILGQEALAKGITPLYMNSDESLSAKTIAYAAEKGDRTAIEVYNLCGKYLGKGISILIDILNPQKIVIGSIFARSKNILWESCCEEIKKEALDVASEVCEVVPAQLGESLGDLAAATVGIYGMRESNE